MKQVDIRAGFNSAAPGMIVKLLIVLLRLNSMMKKYLSELLGTFAIVFFGTGAVVVNEQTGGTITHLGVALTFGLIVTAMIYTLGNVSGAHMNPAVTIA